MTTLPPPGPPLTVSAALARAVVEYFEERAERRTKRLLVHRYPREWLQRACEECLDLTMEPGSPPTIAGKPVQLALVQPPEEVGHLAAYRGHTYGCSPDWPVRARDEGGFLLLLCAPEWYEFLHESLRSNSFLAFDERGRPGAPRQLLERMIEASGLAEPQRQLLWSVASALLEAAGNRRHDRGVAAFLRAVEGYLAGDPEPTPTALRALGLVPDDRLLPDLSVQAIRGRVRDNLAYQETLSADLARSPSRYFAENFPNEADSPTAERLRAHVARFDYDLRADDLRWRAEWPGELTLDLVRRRMPSGGRGRVRATVRRLELEGTVDSFENIPVVRGTNVGLVWQVNGPADALERDVSVFLDGSEVPNAVVQLGERHVQIPDIPMGQHALELRAADGETLQLLGKTHCEVFVTRAGSVPFTVHGQTGRGNHFEVRAGRGFQLVWGSPGDAATVARWALRWQGESGAGGEETFGAHERTYRFANGIVERTDFYLVALGPTEEEVAGAVVVLTPIADDGPRIVPAGTVGQALVDTARRLRQLGEWPQLRQRALRVALEEPSATQYWIRIYDGDEAVLEQLYRIGEAPLLDRFEGAFLTQADQPWLLVSPASGWSTASGAWPIERSAQSEISGWQDALAGIPGFADFLDARRGLVERLRALAPEQEGGIGGIALAAAAEQVRAYADAYERVMAALVCDGGEFHAHHVLLALVDAVAFIGGTWQSPFTIAGNDAEIQALALGPLHPLRVLWLLQFELAIGQTIERGDTKDFNPEAFEGISGINYPPYVLDFDRRFYRNVGVSRNSRWALYLPESAIESDVVLSPVLQRELSLRPTGENVEVSPTQIRNALAYYHEAHPFRDALRFHYIGAGSGEKVVEAIEAWVAQPFDTRSLKAVTAQRMRFHVNFLDVYPSAPPIGTGRAFEEYASQAEGDADLLQRTQFAVQPVEWRQFVRADAPLPHVAKHHMIFGSRVFATRGDAHRVEGRAFQLSAWGLRNPPIKFIEGAEEPRLFVSSLVPPPPDAPPPEAPLERGAATLHRLVYRFQIMSSVSTQSRVYHSDTARMQVIQLDREMLGAIERMHRLAAWVYIVDAHIDVELFDRPGQEGRYILDYRPMIGAIGRNDLRHNYVITTADDTQIVALVARFLQNEYAAAFADAPADAVRTAARRLLQTLNRVSGRALLRILGRPPAVKGVVGMALAHTLYEHLGLLEPARAGAPIRSVRLLVPVDDYFDLWQADQKALDDTSYSDRRADLLDVQVELAGDGVTIDIQVLEVKNLRLTYGGSTLAGPAEQVRATYRTLSTVLFGPTGSGRRDLPIKLAELAQVLDFHIRRALMQRLGDQPGALEVARDFRRAMHEALVAGRAVLRLGVRAADGEEQSAGVVLHFSSEPDIPPFALDAPGAYTVVPGAPDEPLVRYVHLGRSDVAALLRNAGGLCQDDLRVALSGTVLRRGSSRAPSPSARPLPPGGPVPNQLAIPSPVEGAAAGTPEPSVPPEQRERVDQALGAFEGFVGNDNAKELLIPHLVQGLAEVPRRVPINLIFVGPPSTGKTELARRIARTLELPFLQTSAAAISSIDDLLDAMKRQAESERARLRRVGERGGLPVLKFPPMCVFVDEAHELRNPVQNALLTLLEPNDRCGGGPHTPFVADVSDVTFIFATTDFGALDRALRTRLERIDLAPYTVAQVAQIVATAYPGWPEDVYARLAVAGRRSPRIALQRARNLAQRLNTYANEGPSPALERLFELWGIDDLGVSEQDRALLALLQEAQQPRGVSSLASRLQTSEDEITDVIEPYLSELGFIARQPNGRIITEAGRRYLRDPHAASGDLAAAPLR